MKHFCTYFDHNFLSRGLCLYHSLRKYNGDFILWVLCLSDECYQNLNRQDLLNIRLIKLSDLEEFDFGLKKVEPTRSKIEYFFTMSPCLPLYILAQRNDIEDITYLDADLYFFDSFDLVFEEIGDSSIAVIPHSYVPEMLRDGAEKNGIFNVGWITWRNNFDGVRCLKWWREKCLDWCYDLHEEERFADQKYLDKWPKVFKGVKILDSPGFNLAPWNAGNYEYKKEETVTVSGNRLIFYHFHGLKQINSREFDCHLRTYHVGNKKGFLIEHIYLPYIQDLMRQKACQAGSIRSKNTRLVDKLKQVIKRFQTRVAGDIIIVESTSS